MPHSDLSAEEHILWADAIIVVYSIVDWTSYLTAQRWLHVIRKVKMEAPVPVLLLGNKSDMEHCRQVPTAKGSKTAASSKARFCELSAAESSLHVTVAFESLIRDAQLHFLYHPRVLFRCRKSSLLTVTKLILAMFEKLPKKRKPFLSL